MCICHYERAVWTISALLAICFAVGALATACNGDAAANCTPDKCESVGNAQICTECVADNVPINGRCEATAGATDKCTNSGDNNAASKVCGKCVGQTFMYKGGCYETTNAIGKTMCTKAAEGVCTAPASGYFVPGDKVANTEQSVVSCGDAATGVTVAADSGNKYKGIANCEECTTPDAAAGARATDKFAKCTKCSAGKYLKDDGSTTQCVATANDCGDGYAAKQDDTNGNRCLACIDQSNGGAANCAECTYDSANARIQCTKCKDPNYLKTAADGPTTCVAKGDCKDDYFPVDDSTNGHKCVSCGDTAGVTVDTNKKYVGVGGCAKCTEPDQLSTAGTSTATCTECAAGFLYTPTGSTSCVAECPKGYFGHTDSNSKKTCQSCATPESLTPSVTGIPGCASCTYTGGDSGTLTCSECDQGKKPSLDGTSCNTCKDTNCAFCNSEGACQKCISGYILDGAACTQQTCSTPDCKTCNNPKAPSEACTACVSTHYLTPTGQCISDCTALSGYYGDTDKTCKRCGVANCETCNEQGKCSVCTDGFYGDSCSKCDSSCKNCSGSTASDCTACPAGKALKYGSDGTKGTCGEGCTTGTGQGACKTCGLTIEGTAYCSACSVDTEYSQNGVCTSRTIRAATCSDASVSGGVCTTCANGLLKMNGGCYETSRYPGKSVCTEAASTGGTCQTAAPGYKVENGNLVTCSEGCKTCSDASTCTACADGYVLTSSTCTKCDASCVMCNGTATTYAIRRINYCKYLKCQSKTLHRLITQQPLKS
ncbi:Variant-specific surface protein [Giardia duodenalis]|uniref:Variant-specific surface protein n=1 Tax=Giardia intestinalis TaxID=5741 RepID=V6TZW9_GIAIN|nr:Variant-specific surface protein [Giardia intestinalis]